MKKLDFKQIILWLLPLYPIMFMYMIGPVPLGLIVYTPLLLVLFTRRRRLKVDPTYGWLCLLLLLDEFIQLPLSYTDSTVIFHILVPQVIFMASIPCASNYLKMEDILTPYTCISVLYMLGLFYQVFQLFVLNTPIMGPVLLFPDLVSENNVVSEEILRPMSFFQEPQAYATWMSIFLIIMLDRKKYLLAALATVTVLLSGSTEGLVLVAIVWSFYILFFHSKLWVKICILVAVFFIVWAYMTLEIFSVGLNKVVETEYGENERLVQGFRMLKYLDLPGWLFGIGTSLNRYYTAYMSSGGRSGVEYIYMTSAAGTIVTNGVFVATAFFVFLLNKIRLKHKSVFIFSVILLVLPFAQSFFFGSGFVYVISLFYLLKKEKEEEKRQAL